MPGLVLEEYSDKSVVVRGEDTKSHSKSLSELGGRWNPNLKGGGGWIFSNKNKSKVQEYIDEQSNDKPVLDEMQKMFEKLSESQKQLALNQMKKIYEENKK